MKSRRANKAEIVVEEQPKEDSQVCAVTPRPKSKGPSRGSPPASPPKTDPKPSEAKKGGKGRGKGKRSKSDPRPEKRKQQCIPFYRGISKKGDHCNYEHQVDSYGRPVFVGSEILQKYHDAVKRFNENKARAKTVST